jgi:uncharacterized repeat protein (TIGR01451 family)
MTTQSASTQSPTRRAVRLSASLALTLFFCSCRSVPQGKSSSASDEAAPAPILQLKAVAGPSKPIAGAVEAQARVPVEPVFNEGLPIPLGCASPWAPPGIAGPWPHDEYLEDGGDREVQVNLGRDGDVGGLDQEDTVAIYDTLDGRTVIKPSNRVCLYAPRFAAVRKVTSAVQTLQNDQPIGVELPLRTNLHREELGATTAIQPQRPAGGIATKQPSIERVREDAWPAISRQPVAAIDGGLAMYENLRVIRQGIFEESEKARLMQAIDAAIVWSHDQAVQVVLDGRQAVSVTSDQKAQVTYRVDEPEHPCLRIIKIASTKAAKPGDIVEFTIRFDNLGDQTIKRVVLMDSLTTRLEYVAGTSKSSRAADFSTEENEGDSLVLRWEFVDPLPVGQGGLVRFHCRVR